MTLLYNALSPQQVATWKHALLVNQYSYFAAVAFQLHVRFECSPERFQDKSRASMCVFCIKVIPKLSQHLSDKTQLALLEMRDIVQTFT